MQTGDQYKHYKTGGVYEIVGLATLQAPDNSGLDMMECVIYKKEGDEKLWVRPVSMFTENVTDEKGENVPRFSKVD